MSERRSVAIVGAGPKGLYALERLLWHQSDGGHPDLVVDLWDPGALPGVGPVYDPSQPDFLTMNQPAGDVDIWWPENGVVPRARREDFARWSGRDRDEYAPRAEVGRYLADGYSLLLRHASPEVTVTHRRARVERVSPDGRGWCVEATEDRAAYDHVLLATGHNDYVDPGIATGREVAVRGFALTFIDVALTAHHASTGERPVLWPFSRTGRPMLPKPERAVTEGVVGLEEIAHDGLSRLQALRPPVRLSADLLPVVTETADRMFQAAQGEPRPGSLGLAEQMTRDLDVAVGRARPDRAWGLGQAWRSLYPQIAAKAAGDHLAAVDRPAFRRWAADMERLAFGPSPVNAAKLLTLVEAGLVRLDRVGTGLKSGAPVVDAVIAPPGIQGDPLLEQLQRDGHLRPIAGGRGVEVTGDGTCISADGTETVGLTAIGRPTEDAVIGNDTLSRTLHPHIDRWAASVAERRADSRIAA